MKAKQKFDIINVSIKKDDIIIQTMANISQRIENVICGLNPNDIIDIPFLVTLNGMLNEDIIINPLNVNKSYKFVNKIVSTVSKDGADIITYTMIVKDLDKAGSGHQAELLCS